MSFRAAVVQDNSTLFAPDEAIQKVCHWAQQAAAQQCAVVVLPQAFVGGYPLGLDFGNRIGRRTAQGRQMYQQYMESAVSLGDERVTALCHIARDCGIYLVVGVIERVGGSLYDASLTISDEGKLLGVRRNVCPVAGERFMWGRADGSSLRAFEIQGQSGCVALGHENYMPALRMSFYGQQVQLYFALGVGNQVAWAHSMQAIAFESRTFVLSACQFLRPDPDADQELTVPNVETIAEGARGGSCIVGPDGTYLAQPVYDDAALLVADLVFEDTVRGKYDFDVTGHYARADVFSLHVDRRSKEAVSFQDE